MRPTRAGAAFAAAPPPTEAETIGAAGAPAPFAAPPAPAPLGVAAVIVEAPHDIVERVTLHRDATGGADDAHQLSFAELLRGVDAGGVADLLLDHRAVEIVDPEDERDLRQLEPDVDPERLDVTEVVQHQAAHGQHLEVVEAGGARQLAEAGIGRLERERDEGVEAAGVVLELAQPDHVVRELAGLLNVPVEHRGVRLEAGLVSRTQNVQPLLPADLALADEVAHAAAEDLGAATGQRAEARLLELGEHLRHRLAADLGEVRDLARRERLDMDIR